MTDRSPRLLLNDELKIIIGNDNVYFQPPANVALKYPCIVYERDDDTSFHADNLPYSVNQAYQATVIDQDPDSAIVEKLRLRPLCSWRRRFATSGLNHDVFVLYPRPGGNSV